MVYGYARVSTLKQADGNSLEAQEERLREAGAEEVYADAFTGTALDRPGFSDLLARLSPGDTLVVTKMDRLGRSVSMISGLITELIDKGVAVNVLDVGVLSNDSTSVLMRNILLSFAQFERDLIVQRTQEGKEIARRKPGFRDGRPKKYTKKQLDHAMALLEGNSYKQVEEMTGISVSTLAREKRRRLDAGDGNGVNAHV